MTRFVAVDSEGEIDQALLAPAGPDLVKRAAWFVLTSLGTAIACVAVLWLSTW